MPKHNNAVHVNQNRKKYQRFIKTWFDQPAKAQKRWRVRKEKQAKAGITPIDKLKPIVRSPSQKHNYKQRAGRGFSFEELKAVGLAPIAARSIGISVDLRRRNRNEEGLKINTDRLTEYLRRLVVFPRHAKVPKKGRLGIPDDVLAKDVEGKKFVTSIKEAFPIKNFKSALVNPPAGTMTD